MVGKTGFEPATPRSQTECSTKLSHFPILMVRPRGVEPLTFWSVVKCSIQLSYERSSSHLSLPNCILIKKSGGFSWNRTNDTKIFSLVLCQLSYEATWRFVRDLNPWSLAWQASVITTTLTNHNFWLREPDLNQQPLGYEPSELPDCSIPRY